MRKKILFVMPGLYGGGAEKSLINLLNLLDYSKYEVDLLLFKHEGLFLGQVPKEVNVLPTPISLKYSFVPLDKEALKNIEAIKAEIIRIIGTVICKLFYKKREKQARWEYFYIYSIKRLKGQYDVALAYLQGESSYYVIDKVIAPKKYIWIHNDYDKLEGSDSFNKKYFKKANGVISVSDRCVEILKRTFPDLKNKFYMLPNLTSATFIRKLATESFPKEYVEGVPVLLSIGRLTRQKGFDFAIEAAAILKGKNILFKWFIIGTGELEKQLKAKINEKEVTDYIILLGARENPYPYIKNCDILVQTSRWEGKSVVLDEAKILCKPIVVTNYPTVYDQIDDGKEGMIVSMNTEDIADGIQKMLEKEELRNGFSKYLEVHEYGNQDEIQKYIDLIEM